MTTGQDSCITPNPDLSALTPSQIEWVAAVVRQFSLQHEFWRKEGSDLVTPGVLEMFGDALRIHHAFSRQALSKDRFEFALESSLNRAGIRAELVLNRTNRGHDITIAGVPVSLKTQADKSIRKDSLHISKFMELGKGAWELYELVEIPKSLLLEGKNAQLVIQTRSRQNPKPGYGFVYDVEGKIKFALYFDGGTERKLQIKKIRKDLCVVHATWRFDSTPFEQSIPR
jgi:type II restriction enzyme